MRLIVQHEEVEGRQEILEQIVVASVYAEVADAWYLLILKFQKNFYPPIKLSDFLIKKIFGSFLVARHKVDFQGLILPVSLFA